jgi:AraC family transcriptional regulator, glycine betaine-responsive activator
MRNAPLRLSGRQACGSATDSRRTADPSAAHAIEPFRAANELLHEERFAWTVYSESGDSAASSSGITVSAAPFAECDAIDLLLVMAGTSQPIENQRRMNAKLRGLARRGVQLGAISGGVFVLAQAGLLDGYRCSVHWYHFDGFQERFPRVLASRRLFEIDRNRFTCAGGIASLDMILTLMSNTLSRAVRSEISRWVHHSFRSSEEQQPSTDSVRSLVLSKAIAIMNDRRLLIVSQWRVEQAVDGSL